MSKTRIAVIGLGDLGGRIVLDLVNRPGVDEILITGREGERGRSFARLASGCGKNSVKFHTLDALNLKGISEFIKRESPSLIVQCASLISPWLLFERNDSTAKKFLQAGFAAQLSAQLPITTTVMKAVRMSGIDVSVINCSFPDVVNPILHCLDIAPAIGIGNAGMIRRLIQTELGDGTDNAMLRVFAHHSQLMATVISAPVSSSEPRVYLGEQRVDIAPLIYGKTPLAKTRELNALTSAHAVEVILAMLPSGQPCRTSSPGPMGLPGGWPVKISAGHIELDLPSCVDKNEVENYQQCAARGDGIERISPDGTVYFTDAVMEKLEEFSPAIAEPLHPEQSLERFKLIDKVLRNTV